MFVFTVDGRVLGVCDIDHLKEVTEKIWEDACEYDTVEAVIVYGYCKPNVIDYDSPFGTYRFDTYDEITKYGVSTKLGLRLIGLGGEIDIPLGIDVSDEVDITD